MVLSLSRTADKSKQTILHFALNIYQQPIKRKKQGEEKRMTQEEMLLEAAKTGKKFIYLGLNNILQVVCSQ